MVAGLEFFGQHGLVPFLGEDGEAVLVEADDDGRFGLGAALRGLDCVVGFQAFRNLLRAQIQSWSGN